MANTFHLLVGAVAAFWMLSLAACGSATAAGPATLRVVTWNIHHGRGLDDRVDLQRQADELRALAPDLVLLQEVDVGVQRSGRLDLPAELAQRLGMHAAFGKNIDHQGGDYGNAILSRWPITWRQNLHYRMLRAGEQRGLLQVRVAAPGGELAFGCTHIDYRPDDSERLLNCGEILAAVAQHDLLLVGGDFNDLPDSRVHRALQPALVDCWGETGAPGGASYPAAGPRKRIDWLLRRAAAGWHTVSAQVIETAASDHRPVLFVLQRG